LPVGAERIRHASRNANCERISESHRTAMH
jgi:hypothetical protein